MDKRKSHLVIGTALILGSLGLFALGFEENIYFIIAMGSFVPGLAFIITGYLTPADSENENTD